MNYFLTSSTRIALVVALVWLAAPAVTQAGIVGSDTFGDANRTSSPGGFDWFTTESGQALSVVDDSAGIGSGDALQVDITDDYSGVVGQLGQTVTLANAGDDVRLSFDVRFTQMSGGNADNFRWGIYNSQGTALSADNTPSGAADNDRGYYAAIATGSSTDSELFRENGASGEILGGSDRTSLGNGTGGIGDTLTHSVEMSIVRGAADLSITVNLDATTVFSSLTDGLGSAVTSFDEVAIGIGGNRLDYRVDNFLVQSNTVQGTVIPEPSTLLVWSLLAGLGMGLAWWRSWRCRIQLGLLVVVAIGAAFVAPCRATILSEDFESQTVGTNTLPTGWSLITEAGTPTYTNVTGSDGSGGSSGVGGQVSSTAYTGDTDLPGAYIVNAATFDPTVAVTGSLDVYIPNEDIYDDAVFILGDIGSGLTRSAADALSTKLYEGTGAYTLLTDGAGAMLDNTPHMQIADDTWHRIAFSWTPTSGKTGDFQISFTNLNTSTTLGTLSTTGFTFAPSAIQFGFGSVNDTGIFDNISIASAAPTGVIPEPASLLVWSLLGGLGMGLAWRRRGKR